MKLHHVGVVVKDLASYGDAYGRLLGLTSDSEVFHDPLQKVHIQFWRDARGSLLELIEPASEDSPVWRDAKKGGGLNHLCYEVADMDKQIEQSVQQGAMIARPPLPAIAFGGRRVVFLYFLELGLIEFVEQP
jgi:methylmalonyl-CoA/ethylmalonyl-CoA epimerase